MAHLIIEVTDDLARSLEGIAAAQHKSIQDLAIERLSSLVEAGSEHRAGSPAAVLRAMQSPPHPSASDVDELDEAIAGGRLPIRTRDLSRTDPTVIYLLDTNAISALMSADPRTAS